MRPCGFAGPQCPHEATVSVRLAGIGDRSLCKSHYDWCVSMGMDLRVLDPNAPIPEWRKRHGLAKDLTRATGAA